ncbi:MAG: membrane protein insertase YidC [Planctomycetes bacterium]|nr:membrane protein insertase YidC [Planctomycetota bacterium]
MNRNTLLAIVLSALVLILWNAFVLPKLSPPPKPKKKTTVAEEAVREKEPQAEKGKEKPEAEETKPKEETPKPEKPEETKGAKPEKTKKVEGLPEAKLQDNIELDLPDSKLMTTWTNRGGALKRLTFRDYYSDVEQVENLTLLKPVENAPLPLALTDAMMVSGKDVSSPVEEGYALDLDQRRYHVAMEDGTLTFTTGYKNGLEVSKCFELEANAYHLSAALTFRNKGKEAIKLQYSIVACNPIVPEDASGMYIYAFTGMMDDIGRVKVQKVRAGKLHKRPLTVEGEDVDILWSGCDTKYFAAALQPQQEPEAKWIYCAQATAFDQTLPAPNPKGKGKKISNAVMVMTSYPFVIQPGAEAVHRFSYFVGPKDKNVLAKQGSGKMVDLVDFGMFGAISKLLLWLLDGFYALIPNYGFGIIFLTFVVKLCLHPLSRKTQISMHRMQKLQPLVNELKERYKGDQQRLQREQWELFRKHRVNPFGGCLPMFIQIPVFLGLFRALQLSIVFRQQGFILWIKDLSQPDHLAVLPFSLPFIGHELNVLPILMTATWLIQQATMPKSADPQQQQQQKIMMFMPIMFGFMLYHMASGLTLYWMTSTLLGIFEQMYIKRLIAQMPDLEPVEKKKSPKKSSRRRR